MIKQSFTLSVTMLILSFLCPAFLNAQIVTDERMFSFEEPQLPACITGVQSQLGISGAHYKDGKHSLEWTFEPNGRLELRKDLKFEKKDPTGKDLYLSAFIVWIYNEQPQDAAIEFEFLKDGRKCASFPFGINFKGWRAAWVCYERDMQGTPEEGMNELRIVAPDAKGRLFIDHLITATKVDARQQTADLQVPFVNAGTTNHWLVLYKHSLLKPDIELTPVSDKQRQEMKLLEKRFRDMIYTKGKVTEKEAETIRKKYDLYQITYKDGQVSGVPVFMVRASEAYERMIPDWDKDMLTVKKAYDEGLLGNIFTIESKLHSGNGYMHEWHLYKKYGGGMIYDWGVHLIDQILFMMPDAKIKSVYADIKNVLHEEVDDYFKIILKMDNGVTAHIELSTYILKYQPRWLAAGDKGTMIVEDFGCNGSIYRTGKLLEKLPPQITETEAGPTRQFAPVPPGGIVTEPLPEIQTDWVDFYRNVSDVLNGKAESKIKISEVRRVLSVMEAAWKSSETGEAILFES